MSCIRRQNFNCNKFIHRTDTVHDSSQKNPEVKVIADFSQNLPITVNGLKWDRLIDSLSMRLSFRFTFVDSFGIRVHFVDITPKVVCNICEDHASFSVGCLISMSARNCLNPLQGGDQSQYVPVDKLIKLTNENFSIYMRWRCCILWTCIQFK